ncbi:hypothetical protein [Deinococcus sp.]|uniref:hypothetical protein n=1 Tax=Deinococcus sp. TaxID=47478 RepID=UPI003B597674
MPVRLPFTLLSLLGGLLLAMTGLPTAWSILTTLPLSLLLWHLARQPGAKDVAVQSWWAIFAYFAGQLFWLVVFAHNLLTADGGLPSVLAWPIAAALLSLLYALEGVFWAIMAFLVARLFTSPLARAWGLAGGWVILEWTRTLGALAFPWSGLGYTFLRTPIIQAADLGGVLLLSALATASAAALVTWIQARNPRPALLLTVIWLAGLAYGLTRTLGAGPPATALLLRTDFNSFDKATGGGEETLQQNSLRLSTKRRPGEVLIWSETAVSNPDDLARVPAPALTGLYRDQLNTVVGWDGLGTTGRFDKAHPVPFGEYFPLSGTFRRSTTPSSWCWASVSRRSFPARCIRRLRFKTFFTVSISVTTPSCRRSPDRWRSRAHRCW